MKKLLTEYPEIVSEWHPTKNGELKPDEVTHGSHKKVWWLCPKGHPYDSCIIRMSFRTQPPYFLFTTISKFFRF